MAPKALLADGPLKTDDVECSRRIFDCTNDPQNFPMTRGILKQLLTDRGFLDDDAELPPARADAAARMLRTALDADREELTVQ